MRLQSNGSERHVDYYGLVKQVQKDIQRPVGRTGGQGMTSARHNSQILASAGAPLEW